MEDCRSVCKQRFRVFSKLEMLKEWIQEKEERVRVVIGGNFNSRTGRKGGRVGVEEG